MTASELPETAPQEWWDLCLYVAGTTPKCLKAFANLSAICEQHLAGRYRIEVVDLLAQPERAISEQIVAIPTVVRKFPAPLRTVIGDLSSAPRVLAGLQLHGH